jgi:hypothetical protein
MLKRSIEAMGGELILTAKFPQDAPVRLTGFAELDAWNRQSIFGHPIGAYIQGASTRK